MYIKAGALAEKEEQAGVGHLLEHYLATLISKELPRGVIFDAKINDYYIVFYLESENEKILANFIQKFLAILANPDFSHQEIFDYEKKSIINELEKEKNSTELKLERLIEKTRYIDEPNGRSFVDHLQRLEDLKIEDIVAYHKNIFTKENVEIFVSATKSNSHMCTAISDSLLKLHLPEGFAVFPKPTYSDSQIQTYKESGLSGNYMVMTFPSISRSASLRDKIVFALMVEIIRDKDRKNFWQKIREAGIYDLKVTYSQGIYNGYLALQSHVSKEQIMLWLEIICSMIGELKDGKIDPLLFINTKNKWADDRLAFWRSNDGRFSILTQSILDQEEIPRCKTVEDIVASVNKQDISAMAQKTFDKGNINLILFGEDTGLDQDELGRMLMRNGN